jgi:hypothetical protein
MSRLPGHVYLTPEDRDDWLGQIASMAASIDNAHVSAPAFDRWIDAASLAAPASADRPQL